MSCDIMTPTVLYMHATGYLVNWNKIANRLESHPHEAIVQDKYGCTVLRYIVAKLNAPPVSIVKGLLLAHPESAKLADKYGDTPLMIACKRRHPVEVIALLLEANPDAVNQPNESGLYPLEALWLEFLLAYRGKMDYMHSMLTQDMGDKAVGDDVAKFWEEAGLLLSVQRYGMLQIRDGVDAPIDSRGVVTRKVDASSTTHHMLHAAVAAPFCPIPLLRAAIHRYGHQINQADDTVEDQGKVPLAIAASMAPNQMTATGLQDRLEYQKKATIEMLVAAYPEAALIRDKNGQIPLFHAIASGHTWDGGIEDLVYAAPSTLFSREADTGLYPFMYAATCLDSDVNTVYNLIRECPHLVTAEISCNKGLIDRNRLQNN